MNLDQLIAELQKLREEHGGDVPVQMVDGLPVVRALWSDGAIVVTDME